MPDTAPALEIEVVPVADLAPDPDNVRLHGRRNLDAIRSSLTRFGQVRPLLITVDGVVIAGNGRLEVMRSLGWTSVQVIRLPWPDPAQCRAYAITDNRTAELAAWDDTVLAGQVADLAEFGVDVVALGFDLPDPEADQGDDIPQGDGGTAARQCPACGYRWREDADGTVIEL